MLISLTETVYKRGISCGCMHVSRKERDSQRICRKLDCVAGRRVCVKKYTATSATVPSLYMLILTLKLQ